MKTATLLEERSNTFRGYANLYEMNPPYLGHKYVIVICFTEEKDGLETVILPAKNPKSTCDNFIWDELPGSRYGRFTHAEVLSSLGYSIVSSADIPSAKERPCPRCKRMNDIGVSVCWNCELVL